MLIECLMAITTVGKYIFIGKMRLFGPIIAILQSIAAIALGLTNGLYIYTLTYIILFFVDVWMLLRWKKEGVKTI